MRLSYKHKLIIIFFVTGALIAVSMVSTYAFNAGAHTVYINKTNATEFCTKCHTEKASLITSSAHKNAGCICHGYSPNLTAEYNINVAHNLTKQIYCTNCHSDYDNAGDIIIHTGPVVNAPNQSAHYIVGSSNRSKVYGNARQFFEGR